MRTVSSRSHSPVAARHTYDEGRIASLGQVTSPAH